MLSLLYILKDFLKFMCKYYTHFLPRRYTMEMHVIFFKNSCKTVFAAESQKNGYLTLAYLFDVSINILYTSIYHIFQVLY